MALYGDARAHLNVARHVTDGLTPGLAQLGSVWLPLPHLALAPLVAIDPLWHSAVAGAIIGGVGFIYSAVRLYDLTYYWTGRRSCALATFVLYVGCLNLLYIQTTALTEPVLLAFLVGATYHFARWLREMSHRELAMAAVLAMGASMSRYDGWVLIPVGLGVIGLWTHIHDRRSSASEANVVIFGVIAGYGIALWFLYNLVIFGDVLFFIHSGASAQAQQVSLAKSGMLLTAGNAVASLLTYGWAVIDVVGAPLLGLGALGAAVMLVHSARDRWANMALLTILVAPVAFNVLALYTGQSTMRVPQVAPYQMWNIRYGLVALPLLAFTAGTLARPWPPALAAPFLALAIPFAAATALTTTPITIIDGRSGISGVPRVGAISAYLGSHYHGGRILADDTDTSPLLFGSGLNLREFVTVGFKPYYKDALADPAASVAWVVAVPGDDVDRDMAAHPERFAQFTLVRREATISIYRRF